jgi:N-acetylglucosamine-6-phosphate deacetylase
VEIEAGRIVAVREGKASRQPGAIHLETGILAPGLVDLQVNGYGGIDFASAGIAGWRHAQAALLATGVTAFLPALITAPLEVLERGLGQAATVRRASHSRPVARVLGVHLEGPFLSASHHGAHDPQWLLPPALAHIDRLLAASQGSLALITLAPELEGGLEAVRKLTSAGVLVSIGHSNATAAQTAAAACAGARMVTHLFNAQRGIHHREPGVAGQALIDGRLSLCLILDLTHVAEAVCRLVFAAAGRRVVMVTDATAAAGQAAGQYRLGGDLIEVGPSGPPRRLDGTLAGSVLRLDEAIANAVALGVDLSAAVDAASRLPADLIGRRDLGRILPGAQADLVWLGDDLLTRATWIGGKLAYGGVSQ